MLKSSGLIPYDGVEEPSVRICSTFDFNSEHRIVSTRKFFNFIASSSHFNEIIKFQLNIETHIGVERIHGTQIQLAQWKRVHTCTRSANSIENKKIKFFLTSVPSFVAVHTFFVRVSTLVIWPTLALTRWPFHSDQIESYYTIQILAWRRRELSSIRTRDETFCTSSIAYLWE